MLNIYKRCIQSYFEKSNSKNSRSTSDLIGNKIADKVTKVSRSSPNNSSETVKSKTENIGYDRVKLKKIYMSPEKKQQIIAKLRLFEK